MTSSELRKAFVQLDQAATPTDLVAAARYAQLLVQPYRRRDAPSLQAAIQQHDIALDRDGGIEDAWDDLVAAHANAAHALAEELLNDPQGQNCQAHLAELVQVLADSVADIDDRLGETEDAVLSGIVEQLLAELFPDDGPRGTGRSPR